MRLPSFRRTSNLVSVTKDADKGIVLNNGVTTLGASAFTFVDLDTTGFSTLWLLAQIGNATTPATAAADVLVGLHSYLSDGVTLFPQDIPSVMAGTPSLAASIARQVKKFDVSGFDKTRVYLGNGNVGALQGGRLDYFLQA